MALLRIPEDYATLALAQTAAASGDTISIADGTILRDVPGAASANVWSSTGKNVTITRRYDGSTKPIITGATPVALSTNWTQVGATSVYTTPLATGLVITGLTVGYYTNPVKSAAPCIGARCGWINDVALAASVTDGSTAWHYDSGTGLLTVSAFAITGGAQFGNNEVEWIRGVANNAITIASSTGSSVVGISFDRISARFVTTADGAGILFSSCTSCSAVDCDFYDCNDKGLAFSGATNVGNLATRCRFWGCTAQNPDSQLNFFTTSGTISGGVVTDCEFYICGLYTVLAFTGVLAPRPTGIAGWASGYGSTPLAGFASHVTTVGTHFISDIEVNGCSFEVDSQFFLLASTAGYPGRGVAEYVTGTAGLTGSEWLVDSYPVRFYDCTMNLGMGIIWQSAGYVAYDRCNLVHNAGAVNALYATNGGGAAKAVFAFGSGSTNAGVLISGTYLASSNRATTTTLFSILGFGNNTAMEANLSIRGVKSAIIDLSVCAASQLVSILAPYPVTYFASNQGVNATAFFDSCIFAKVSGASLGDMVEYARCLFIYGNELSGADEHNGVAGQFMFNNCIGYGWPQTATTVGGWSTTVQASWCSTAGFTSIDPAKGISRNFRYGTSTMFAAPSTSALPASGSNGAALRLQNASPVAEIPGVNGQAGQNTGPYQYGGIQDSDTVQSALLID